MFHLSNVGFTLMEEGLLKIAKCVSQAQAIKFTLSDSLVEEFWYQKNLIANLVFIYQIAWQYRLCTLVNDMHDKEMQKGRLLTYLGSFSNPPGNSEEQTIFKEGFKVLNQYGNPMYLLTFSFPVYPAIEYLDLSNEKDFITHRKKERVPV